MKIQKFGNVKQDIEASLLVMVVLPRVLLDRRTGCLFFESHTTDAQLIVLSCL